MAFLFYILIFVFGLCFGSFLNVLIARLPKEQGIGGWSRCPHCRHRLVWRDLIPLVSFFILRGRCRYCCQHISWQYPLVELATGILFIVAAGSVFILPLSVFTLINLVYWLLITACLIVVFVSDLRYFIIPDEIIVFGAITAFFYRLFEIWRLKIKDLLAIGHWPEGVFNHLGVYLLVALAAAAFFLLIVIVTKGRGMGLGDVKFAFLMGLILGWPKILAALFLAFLSGAIVGLGLVLVGKAKMKSAIPFGVFLSFSAFVIMLFGNGLINWWLGLFW